MMEDEYYENDSYIAHMRVWCEMENDWIPLTGNDGSTLRLFFECKHGIPRLMSEEECTEESRFSCRVQSLKEMRWKDAVWVEWGSKDKKEAVSIIFQKSDQAEKFKKTVHRMLRKHEGQNLRHVRNEHNHTEMTVSSDSLLDPIRTRADTANVREPIVKEKTRCSLTEMENELETVVQEARRCRKKLMEIPFDFKMEKEWIDALYTFMNNNPTLITGRNLSSYHFWDRILREVPGFFGSTSIIFKYYHSKLIMDLSRSILNPYLQLSLLQFFKFRISTEDRMKFFENGWFVSVDEFGFVLSWRRGEVGTIEKARALRRSRSPIEPPLGITSPSDGTLLETLPNSRIFQSLVSGEVNNRKRQVAANSYPLIGSVGSKAPRPRQLKLPYTIYDQLAQWRFVYQELKKGKVDKLKLSTKFWSGFEKLPFRQPDTWRKHFEVIKQSLHKVQLPENMMRELYETLKIPMEDSTRRSLERRFFAKISLLPDGTVDEWIEAIGNPETTESARSPDSYNLTAANNAMIEEDEEEET